MTRRFFFPSFMDRETQKEINLVFGFKLSYCDKIKHKKIPRHKLEVKDAHGSYHEISLFLEYFFLFLWPSRKY